MTTLILDINILNNLESGNSEYCVDSRWYNRPAGQQPYKLYSYLSKLFNNTTILDIGTHKGNSAP